MKILSAVFVMLLLVSCNEEAAPLSTETGSFQENRQHAEAWLDAFANNSHENLDEVMSPDVVVYGFGGVESMTYAEVVEKMDSSAQRKNYSPFTDRRWMAIPEDSSIFDGEGVLFWGTSILNLKSGVSISLPIHIVTIVKDGKIASMHFYYDVFKILRESGYTFVPPG